jgi:SAM-dependent methyltransferase
MIEFASMGPRSAAAAATWNEVRDESGLRECVECPFCGSAGHAPVTGPMRDEESGERLAEPFRSMRFQMVACAGCGLVYQRVRPRQADIGRFYSAEYHCYESYAERGRIFRLLAGLVARGKRRAIERLLPPGNVRVLDYGCGSGTWLELLQDAGVPWELVGTEIEGALLAPLRRRGIAAHVCDDRTLLELVSPGSVGVVHLFHVIEHVPDPLRLLRVLREVLAPGGAVYGQTPNVDCLERRLFGDYWNQWHFPRHLVLFSPATLRACAEKAGLEVVSITSSPSSATQWSASLLKWWALRRGRAFRSTAEPLYPILTLAFAPLALVHARLANTSHMDFVLRRPRG